MSELRRSALISIQGIHPLQSRYHWDYSMGYPEHISFEQTEYVGGVYIDMPFRGTAVMVSNGLKVSKQYENAYNSTVLFYHPGIVISPNHYFEKIIKYVDATHETYFHNDLEEWEFSEIYGTKNNNWTPYSSSALIPSNYVLWSNSSTLKSTMQINGSTALSSFWVNNTLIKSNIPISRNASFEADYKNQLITDQYGPGYNSSCTIQSIDLIWY